MMRRNSIEEREHDFLHPSQKSNHHSRRRFTSENHRNVQHFHGGALWPASRRLGKFSMNFFSASTTPLLGRDWTKSKKEEKKKDSNVAGRWAGPGKRTKGSGIEGWKIRRRRVVNYPKKNTTKYHVARGRKLRAFFFNPWKGGRGAEKR